MILTLLTSCWRSDDESKYDLCRVEVDTYLNIREEPNSRSKILGTVRKDALITVLDDGNGWSQLYMDDKPVGYLSNDFLVLVKARKTDEDNGQPAEMHPMGDTGDDEEWAAMAESETGDLNSEALAAAESDGEPTFEKVSFIGQDSLLTADQKAIIEARLSQIDGYLFVVNTSSNVDKGELFDYAPDMLDALTHDMDSQMGWWKRVKSWFGSELPSANLVLLSYIVEDGQGGLLQAECNGNSLKYLKIKQPEVYFDCQLAAMRSPAAGIAAMGEAIAEAGDEYKSRNWLIRTQVNTGNILENICDDVVVENILPRNSFWHKWIFSWVFALPSALADWIMGFTGSFTVTLLIIMLVILGFHIFSSKAQIKLDIESQKTDAGDDIIKNIVIYFSFGLVKFFLWLTMLSMIVYMTPDLSKIYVMNMSGFSEGICKAALTRFVNFELPGYWWIIVIFILGAIIAECVAEGFVIDATGPAKLLKFTIERMDKGQIEKLSKKYDVEIDKEKLLQDEQPFSSLATEYFSKKIETVWPLLVLAFVFSGAILLYCSIFFWTKATRKIITIINGILEYRKRGVYKIK